MRNTKVSCESYPNFYLSLKRKLGYQILLRPNGNGITKFTEKFKLSTFVRNVYPVNYLSLKHIIWFVYYQNIILTSSSLNVKFKCLQESINHLIIHYCVRGIVRNKTEEYQNKDKMLEIMCLNSTLLSHW